MVGSGAGGGTVAARLAEAGMTVFLLEAGGDPCETSPEEGGLPEEYQVPAFHAFASENPAISWSFYVHDYGDDSDRRRPKEDSPPGVLYPRAGTLGGCTAHNALILMYPHDSDWDEIAKLTGDASWSAAKMRRCFHLLENCRERPVWRFLARLSVGRFNPTGHGWSGWLHSEVPAPLKAFGDKALMRIILEAVRDDLEAEPSPPKSLAEELQRYLRRVARRSVRFFVGENDPNDQRMQGRFAAGLCRVPLSTADHQRRGTRERLLDVRKRYPNRLHIELHALATKVIFDSDNRAVGVEYLKGENLYRASPRASPKTGEPRTIHAAREVILAGGVFNTPQLLMLSGIGPPAHLSRLGIEVKVPLSGVGRNLQDRYEVGIVHKASKPWACMEGVRFDKNDQVFADWRSGRGMYMANGGAIAFTLRSREKYSNPDLFVMALVTRFSGYFPGYSKIIRSSRDDLTWAVLKAHTINRAGMVTLKSKDPRDPPDIDFRYFEEGSDHDGDDLAAVLEGIRVVRRIAAKLESKGLIHKEAIPGADLQSEEELREFVRKNAWGHHACGTCAIGPREAGGVLSSDFRVHGTKGLRVVDASIFPRIPGIFIVSAVYMIGEKAATVILATKKQ